MKPRVHVAIAAVLLPSMVFGCEFLVNEAEPLWALVHDADAIVLASVASIEDPSEPDALPRLHLNVVERWSGKPPHQLAVESTEDLHPGDVVAVFLVKAEGDGWNVYDVPEGLVNARQDDLEIYAARVKEAIAIDEKQEGRISRMEWLVRCAEHRVTRHEGVRELLPREIDDGDESDRLSIPPFELLTDEHRSRIAGGFVREPSVDAALPMLIELLGDYEDLRFEREVLAAIEAKAATAPGSAEVFDSARAATELWGVTFAGLDTTLGGWKQIVQ